MKYLDQDFQEYILSYKKQSLLTKPRITYDKLQHIILYGVSGVGKYSSLLYYLSAFSPTQLKYDKKITINTSKDHQYHVRISDIHYEIDIEQLGCNAKTLWHDIYTHILNIIIQKKTIQVIVCKNFHKIDNDLLHVFYSYIQDMRQYSIKMILLTEHISFIPNNILNSFNIIFCSKLSHSLCVRKIGKVSSYKTSIEKLKEYKSGFPLQQLIFKKTVNLLDTMEQYPNISFITIREMLYEILIYDLDIYEVSWFIISNLLKRKRLVSSSNVLSYCYKFFKMYNNNYRPIYHLEKFIYYILLQFHEYE